ncbi:trace amine-associated receptor 4 [Nematostella vectensis]|uniref:trace amine-associated receptor 4 n=1 Tax=Nematostella vectensis TaxID=45351 RepID=UPI0013901D53|nr:trace amine-associated receptor 4 [Nematostella vectensis]
MKKSCLFYTYDSANFTEKSSLIVLIILNSVTMAATSILNLLIMMAIRRSPALHSPSKILLFSLATSDFLVGIALQPMYTLHLMSMVRDWPSLYCIFSSVRRPLGLCLCAVSTFTITSISIDRCLAVRLKMDYPITVTFKRVVSFIVFAWIVAICLTVLLLIMAVEGNPENMYIVVFVALFTCVLVIIVSYTLAYLALRRTVTHAQDNSPSEAPRPSRLASPAQRHHSFSVSKYKRSFATMLYVVVFTVLCYVPFGLVSVLNDRVDLPLHQWIVVINASELCVVLNSALNPVLYLWRMRELRSAVVRTTRRIFGATRVVYNTNNTTPDVIHGRAQNEPVRLRCLSRDRYLEGREKVQSLGATNDVSTAQHPVEAAC